MFVLQERVSVPVLVQIAVLPPFTAVLQPLVLFSAVADRQEKRDLTEHLFEFSFSFFRILGDEPCVHCDVDAVMERGVGRCQLLHTGRGH